MPEQSSSVRLLCTHIHLLCKSTRMRFSSELKNVHDRNILFYKSRVPKKRQKWHASTYQTI